MNLDHFVGGHQLSFDELFTESDDDELFAIGALLLDGTAAV